jgi:hypothetical protein
MEYASNGHDIYQVTLRILVALNIFHCECESFLGKIYKFLNTSSFDLLITSAKLMQGKQYPHL